MNNEPNKKNGAKPAVAHKKNILDDRRIRLALSVLGAIVAWMVVTIIVQPGTSNTIYNVPVDYTPVRFVKKPSGGRPGMVIYSTCRTVNVAPEEGLVKKLQLS